MDLDFSVLKVPTTELNFDPCKHKRNLSQKGSIRYRKRPTRSSTRPRSQDINFLDSTEPETESNPVHTEGTEATLSPQGDSVSLESSVRRKPEDGRRIPGLVEGLRKSKVLYKVEPTSVGTQAENWNSRSPEPSVATLPDSTGRKTSLPTTDTVRDGDQRLTDPFRRLSKSGPGVTKDRVYQNCAEYQGLGTSGVTGRGYDSQRSRLMEQATGQPQVGDAKFVSRRASLGHVSSESATGIEDVSASVVQRRNSLALSPTETSPSVAQRRDSVALSSTETSPSVAQRRDSVALSSTETSSSVAQRRDSVVLSSTETSSSVAQRRDSVVLSSTETPPSVAQRRDSLALSSTETSPSVAQRRDSVALSSTETFRSVVQRRDSVVLSSTETSSSVAQRRDSVVLSSTETPPSVAQRRDSLALSSTETSPSVAQRRDSVALSSTETFRSVVQRRDSVVLSSTETSPSVPQRRDSVVLSSTETSPSVAQRRDSVVLSSTKTSPSVIQWRDSVVLSSTETSPSVVQLRDSFVLSSTEKSSSVIQQRPVQNSMVLPFTEITPSAVNRKSIKESAVLPLTETAQSAVQRKPGKGSVFLTLTEATPSAVHRKPMQPSPVLPSLETFPPEIVKQANSTKSNGDAKPTDSTDRRTLPVIKLIKGTLSSTNRDKNTSEMFAHSSTNTPRLTPGAVTDTNMMRKGSSKIDGQYWLDSTSGVQVTAAKNSTAGNLNKMTVTGFNTNEQSKFADSTTERRGRLPGNDILQERTPNYYIQQTKNENDERIDEGTRKNSNYIEGSSKYEVNKRVSLVLDVNASRGSFIVDNVQDNSTLALTRDATKGGCSVMERHVIKSPLGSRGASESDIAPEAATDVPSEVLSVMGQPWSPKDTTRADTKKKRIDEEGRERMYKSSFSMQLGGGSRAPGRVSDLQGVTMMELPERTFKFTLTPKADNSTRLDLAREWTDI